jgi:hypothetical protein
MAEGLRTGFGLKRKENEELRAGSIRRMEESSKTSPVAIDGVFYSLAHVPELVRFGSKPAREIRVRPELEGELGKRLRSFSAATAYALHQVFIGNLTRFSFFEMFLT